jgi:phosphoribosylformimino-5-aminoimidazole carboxamide ribotide isomerase
MIQIIPAIDLSGGKCVRLNQGDFLRQRVYDADPVDMAKRFADAGLERLHLVDLDGARVGRPQNLDILERITSQTKLVVDFSGGLREERDVAAALDGGAALVCVGSAALKEPQMFESWLRLFGSDRFLLAADVANGCVAVNAWQELSDTDVCSFLSYWMKQGIDQAFCTSIAFDGMMNGPDLSLYDRIRLELPALKLLASGGARSMADVAALERAGCAGVIIGKAFYEGGISLSEINKLQTS